MNLYDDITNRLESFPKIAQLNPDYSLRTSKNFIKGDQFASPYILINKNTNEHILITNKEAFIWNTLKVNPDIKNLVYEYFKVFDRFAIELINSVLVNWEQKGIVSRLSIFDQIESELESRKASEKLHRGFRIINFQINIKFLSACINILYKYVFKKVLHAFWLIPLIATAIVVNVIFLVYLSTNPEILTAHYGFNGWYVLILILLSLLSIFLHELSHGIALNAKGIKVTNSGFSFYFGIPVFYVDTTKIWLEKRENRLIVSAAGLITNLILAMFGILGFFLFESEVLTMLSVNFAFTNILNVLINLNPFIEFDGYYLMIDLLNNPNIKQKAFSEIPSLIKGKPIKREELKHIIYVVLSILSTIIMTSYSVYLLTKNFGG